MGGHIPKIEECRNAFKMLGNKSFRKKHLGITRIDGNSYQNEIQRNSYQYLELD
jgi:hypothetical protein